MGDAEYMGNKQNLKMEKLRMSPAEILKEVQIKPIEMECLKRVFEYLSKPPHHPVLTYIFSFPW